METGRDAIRSKAEHVNNTIREQWKIESENLTFGRITTTKEVANTIAFLLSDAAENIVGESVKLSGGSVMCILLRIIVVSNKNMVCIKGLSTDCG